MCVKPRKTDNGVVGRMASLGDEDAKETTDGGSRGGVRSANGGECKLETLGQKTGGGGGAAEGRGG